MPLHNMLLSVALLVHTTTGRIYYVTPEDSSSTINNDAGNSLGYYLKNTSKYFSSNSQLKFKPGDHYLSTDLVIQDVTNVTLTGEGLSIIRCTSSVEIIIQYVIDLKLENIVFENCNANYSNHLHTSFIHKYRSTSTISKPTGNTSILLYHCLSVSIGNITVIVNEGNSGVLFVNVRNHSKISNIHIIVQTNRLSFNKSLLQTNGVLLYYDNWNNSDEKSSIIQLDKLNFSINGPHMHPIYNVVKSFLRQNNSNVSIVIQNTRFTDLINVTAVYYYGETCGVAVSSELTIKNCSVSNTIGSLSLKMFYIRLKNIKCIKFNEYITSCHRQQYINVTFTNCTFENNSNVSSMIYVSPVSSRSVTFYLYLKASSFHNNKNAHFLTMRNDEDNIWQLSNHFWMKNINITSNVHDRGQDLMSFTNSMVGLRGPIKVMDNKYYDSIWNFHVSISNYKYSIDIINNTVRQLLTGTFTILTSNTTITITRNIVYILLNQVRTYSRNSEPLCSVQFYAGFDISDASNIMVNVSMSNNVHMISKYLPRYDNRCRWLAGSAFPNDDHKFKPKRVYEQLVKIENNTVISENEKRPIPLSICKCVHPDPLSGAQYSDDCYSSDLGSIFPGQTLKAVLVVKKQLPQYLNISAINVAVHNTEDDDCNVVDTFQLSQTHLNYECNNYSYTLWPKNKSIEVCKLFIYSQNMLEMFHIQFKPCPLGFTLQEDKKSCYCDPILSNNEVISIKSCNLNDETISRPAYSWISVKRNNDTDNVTYIVSTYCQVQRCLPYQSHLKLSNPDSQCQFNRTGLLCGKCQQGLSAVLGSHQCKHCSNIYLLLALPITIIGIVFVALLYIFDLTIRYGTINTCIFYINILNINILMVFSNCESFICVILSYMNFEFRAKTCFYNGMDDYAKLWIYFLIPLFLIIIATLLIILSRYSAVVQRLTSKKALPVLATLLLFSYIKLLIFVCRVLFQYSTITYLPSNKTELVWSVSPTTPLFGLKFLSLFIVCAILFFILLPFNLVLLFKRTLSCLKVVTAFKPILDPYFAPYKDSAYYWTGLLLLVRVIVYVLLSLSEDTHLIISVIFSGLLYFHTTVQPFKNKFHNIQECFTLLNLSAIHTALSYQNKFIGLQIAKVLITIGAIYFILAIVLHCCMYRCNNMIHKGMNWFSCKINNVKCIKWLCHKICAREVQTLKRDRYEIRDMNNNYQEFQEPLVALGPND